MKNEKEIKEEIERLFKHLRYIRRDLNWYETQQEQTDTLQEIKVYWCDLSDIVGNTVAHMVVEALRFKYL